MSSLNVLLLGSGGREHAMAWRLSQSPLLAKLWIAPGNAGTADCGENVADVAAGDIDGVAALAKRVRADLVIVGPEDPLAAGIADRLTVEARKRDLGHRIANTHNPAHRRLPSRVPADPPTVSLPTTLLRGRGNDGERARAAPGGGRTPLP